MAWVEVTDPNELAQAQMMRAIQNSFITSAGNKKVDVDSALKTFGKSTFSAAPSAIANLGEKIGLMSPEFAKKITPFSEDAGYQRGREMHPVAAFGGDVLGFGPVGIGTGTAFRALPGISNLMRGAGSSILKKGALHGAEGAAMGGLYSEPGQELEGALTGAVALPLGIGAYKAGKFLPKSTDKALAESIISNKKKLVDLSTEQYNNLFKQFSNAGVNEVKVPNSNVAFIKEYAPEKYTKSLDTFIEKSTPENAHWAQSDLNKLLQKLGPDKILVGPEKKLRDEVRALKNQIVKNMFEHKSVQNLIKPWEKLSREYAVNVAPIRYNKSIIKYESDKRLPADFISEIMANKDIRSTPFYEELSPQFKANKLLRYGKKKIPAHEVLSE